MMVLDQAEVSLKSNEIEVREESCLTSSISSFAEKSDETTPTAGTPVAFTETNIGWYFYHSLIYQVTHTFGLSQILARIVYSSWFIHGT